MTIALSAAIGGGAVGGMVPTRVGVELAAGFHRRR
jgi:hypothetical protein